MKLLPEVLSLIARSHSAPVGRPHHSSSAARGFVEMPDRRPGIPPPGRESKTATTGIFTSGSWGRQDEVARLSIETRVNPCLILIGQNKSSGVPTGRPAGR